MFIRNCVRDLILLVVTTPIVTSVGCSVRGKHPHHRHSHKHISTYSTPAAHTIISASTSITSGATTTLIASEISTLSTPTTAAPSTSVTTIPRPPAEYSPLIPNGIKAGIAGGDAYLFMENHIGWWYDWYVCYNFYNEILC